MTAASAWLYTISEIRFIETKNPSYIFPNVIYHSNRWTYYKDGAYVYKAIGGTKIKFGAGKSNTNIVMAADDGAYITENSNGKPTIWYKIKLLNDSVYNQTDLIFVLNYQKL